MIFYNCSPSLGSPQSVAKCRLEKDATAATLFVSSVCVAVDRRGFSECPHSFSHYNSSQPTQQLGERLYTCFCLINYASGCYLLKETVFPLRPPVSLSVCRSRSVCHFSKPYLLPLPSPQQFLRRRGLTTFHPPTIHHPNCNYTCFLVHRPLQFVTRTTPFIVATSKRCPLLHLVTCTNLATTATSPPFFIYFLHSPSIHPSFNHPAFYLHVHSIRTTIIILVLSPLLFLFLCCRVVYINDK